MQTVHVYIVPEEQLPPRPDYAGLIVATLCSFILIGIVGLTLVSPKTEPTVSFRITIVGYRLPPVSKTISVPVQATGHGHVNATYAHGTITFYNGQTYTQMIPVGTILKGTDGVAVITDAQANIPPAAQTTPPTYGQVTVPAHALDSGTRGNIQAGAINMPCCVTSVIAQNSSSFTGGRDARDFLYLTQRDVTDALALLIPPMKVRTLAALTSTVMLEPTCSTVSSYHPAIDQETTTAVLTLTVSCTAISYDPTALQTHVRVQEKQFGDLSAMHITLVSITQRKGVPLLFIYGTAVMKPIVRMRFGATGK
jgi:hypothetical protein